MRLSTKSLCGFQKHFIDRILTGKAVKVLLYKGGILSSSRSQNGRRKKNKKPFNNMTTNPLSTGISSLFHREDISTPVSNFNSQSVCYNVLLGIVKETQRDFLFPMMSSCDNNNVSTPNIQEKYLWCLQETLFLPL